MGETTQTPGSSSEALFSETDSFLLHIKPSAIEAALTPIPSGLIQPSLWPLMERKIKEGQNTDLTVCIDQTRFPCHLLPLQCFSEFFEQEVTPGKELIELPGEKVSPAAFRIVYEWILDPRRRLEAAHFTAVLVAAEFLRIPALVERCWQHLDSPRVVEDVAFYVFLQSIPFRCSEVQSMMLRRVCRFFLALVSTPEFCEMTLEDLSVLLSSNIIGVFDETDVLFAVCLWLLYDWFERSDLVDEAMQLVRFEAMRAADLGRLCIFRECAELQPILRHPTTKQLVDKALASVCARELSSDGDVHGQQTDLRIRLQADSPETKAFTARERCFERFNDFMALIRSDPTIWQTFRVAGGNTGPLPEVFAGMEGGH
ncbi:uncharacterized protein LOC118456232 [Anopheles albimanus]|nr:uncharacterized protein LOC118456232 [Anopheles albimanus]